MDLRVRHKQRFNRVNSIGGAGSPQAYDEDHELVGFEAFENIPNLVAPATPEQAAGGTGGGMMNPPLTQLAIAAQVPDLIEAFILALPTSLPAQPNKLWLNGGVLCVSE